MRERMRSTARRRPWDAPWSTCAITDILRICFGLSIKARSIGIVKFTCAKRPHQSTAATLQLSAAVSTPDASRAHWRSPSWRAPLITRRRR